MIPAKLIAKDTAISPTPVHKDKAPTMISLRDIFLFEESCALFQHFSSVQHGVWRCNCVTLATLGSNERMLLCTLTTLHTGPPDTCPPLPQYSNTVEHNWFVMGYYWNANLVIFNEYDLHSYSLHSLVLLHLFSPAVRYNITT